LSQPCRDAADPNTNTSNPVRQGKYDCGRIADSPRRIKEFSRENAPGPIIIPGEVNPPPNPPVRLLIIIHSRLVLTRMRRCNWGHFFSCVRAQAFAVAALTAVWRAKPASDVSLRPLRNPPNI
jgi:hypothetical protein